MPISPRAEDGFELLESSRSNMDNGIPLAQVRSNASSTGARKHGQGTSTGLETLDQSQNEKHGFFHRGKHAGRRKAKTREPTRSDSLASEETNLNAMGKLYKTIIGFSKITRYLVYIAPVALLLAVPIIVVAVLGKSDTPVGSGTTGDNVNVPGPPLLQLFVWIEAAWLSLWLGKIVASLLPLAFMFLSGVVSSGTRKYATVIKNLGVPLSLFFWALASWLIFKNVIQGQYDAVSWVDTIKKILGAIFVSSAVFLGEKAIVQLISVTYHQRSFANRIRESKREIHLLGLLYDASRALFPMYCNEFAEEDYIINDSIEMMLGGKRGHKASGSVTPMRLVGNVGRFGDKVTSVFGNVASEITGKKIFNPNSAHSVVVEALEKVRTSEALARRIWMSFVVEGKDALYMDDVAEVLGPAYRDEADECFSAIDADGNGDISLDEMVRKVVAMSKERKAISSSMKDIGQALAVFDRVLLFIVLFIVILIFLVFFQSSFITTLTTAGTTLLSLSFIFAVTAQEFLGSCIFLFVKHPYDVGDRVDISGSEKLQLVVERISLLYTVFNRIDKMQTVQVPNIVLNNLWIENVSRSKAMKEVLDVNVSFDTTFEDIELLRMEMENFVRHPDNSRDFQPDLAISVGGVGDLDKINLKVIIKHKSNWHNEAVRATRRSKFMCALTLALKRVPIFPPGGGYEPLGGPLNPAYNVAVSDQEAAKARETASAKKEAARLVPSQPAAAKDKEGSDNPEMQAAQDLNTIDPARAAEEDWGYNRDDDTVAPLNRQKSLEQVRSNDIESLRSELHKKESQRGGRRKPGEGIPASAWTSHGTGPPEIQVTQPTGGMAAGFDEEAQVYRTNSTTQPAFSGRQHQRVPPPPGGAANVSNMPGGGGGHPLQDLPPASSANPAGQRARGASVSRAQQGSNNPYQQR